MHNGAQSNSNLICLFPQSQNIIYLEIARHLLILIVYLWCYKCTIPSFLLLNAWTSENFDDDVQLLACRILEHLGLLLECFLKEWSLFQGTLDQLGRLLLDCLECLRQQIITSFLILLFVPEIITLAIFIYSRDNLLVQDLWQFF